MSEVKEKSSAKSAEGDGADSTKEPPRPATGPIVAVPISTTALAETEMAGRALLPLSDALPIGKGAVETMPGAVVESFGEHIPEVAAEVGPDVPLNRGNEVPTIDAVDEPVAPEDKMDEDLDAVFFF